MVQLQTGNELMAAIRRENGCGNYNKSTASTAGDISLRIIKRVDVETEEESVPGSSGNNGLKGSVKRQDVLTLLQLSVSCTHNNTGQD
ncbi:hypothetical protein Q5P01_024185 [Channa striata]|uniref:Uncharacterized protein n=1 Tax=Channa striata TaxID=64152 RepID=A0AA88IZF1_CHASR|nr:hypothetical protein Q5P01_024185 [Channa striata]